MWLTPGEGGGHIDPGRGFRLDPVGGSHWTPIILIIRLTHNTNPRGQVKIFKGVLEID